MILVRWMTYYWVLVSEAGFTAAFEEDPAVLSWCAEFLRASSLKCDVVHDTARSQDALRISTNTQRDRCSDAFLPRFGHGRWSHHFSSGDQRLGI